MYDQIFSFKNLYKAHMKARRSKRHKCEVILYEMNLGENLTKLEKELINETYKIKGYYKFMINDPKLREIQALSYEDRIVQKALCDGFLSEYLERRLIYDNAACRKDKGTDFARERLKFFLRRYYKTYGNSGYVLKMDIRKYFDSIDHLILKDKFNKVKDERIKELLYEIVDSYEKTSNKGLPMGNQTSQWFALYYLDGVDRLIKENLRIEYYTRYMDDMILIHHNKEYLNYCLNEIKLILNKLKLELNDKTEITPITHGIEYLGFRFYLLSTGKINLRLRSSSKRRIVNKYKKVINNNKLSLEYKRQVDNSYKEYTSRCIPKVRLLT